jgi:crossover junction endodeoxyribonuclease RusA
MTRQIVITVDGRPAPQGSKRLIGGRLVESSKAVRPWRDAVRSTAAAETRAIDGWEPLREPVRVRIEFFLPRPKSHYRANGELRPDAPRWVSSKPDLDKLARSVLDALTDAGVVADDSFVVVLSAHKEYANASPGAEITVSTLT